MATLVYIIATKAFDSDVTLGLENIIQDYGAKNKIIIQKVAFKAIEPEITGKLKDIRFLIS